MDDSRSILRCKIEGRWAAEEMAYSFLHMRDLYNLRLTLQVAYESRRDVERFYDEFYHFSRRKRGSLGRFPFPIYPFAFLPEPRLPVDSGELARLAHLVYPGEQLEVRRVEYASPGIKDFAGFGEIVGHLKDLLLGVMQHVIESPKRRLENEERSLRNQALRIENAQKYVDLAERCGYGAAEIRSLVHWVDARQDTFIRLAEAGKMTDVAVLSPDESNPNLR